MEMINAEQVAKILGVSRSIIYGWCHKKKCPFGVYRIGESIRFNKNEVLEYLEKARQ
jgi:excisionase family DNA binding protein